MVFARPPISNISRSFNKSLGIVSSAPITCIAVTFLFHYIFSSLARSKYLSLFSFTLVFAPWLAEMVKSISQQVLFFVCLLTITWSPFLPGIRWSVCIPKSQRILSVSFFRTDSDFCIYHLAVWSNLNFLLKSRLSSFLTCLVWYSFCAIIIIIIITIIITINRLIGLVGRVFTIWSERPRFNSR